MKSGIKSFIALIAILGFAQQANCGVFYRQNVGIIKIAASSSGNFLYVDPAVVATACAVSSAQTGSFGVLYIPNRDILATLLTAQSTGKQLRLLVVSDNVGPFSATYSVTTPCQIENIEVQ